MLFNKPIPKSDLEELFLDGIETDTPDKVKNLKPIDCNNKEGFTFTLYKEQLGEFEIDGQGLGIDNWFKNYEKEALVSTAGIRGLQNPLYPWDTRYPINFIGMTLATMGKILVAKGIGNDITKAIACEVRYNSKEYVEIIARLQAANGIKTYTTENYIPIPIFLISFIIFMYDLYGGEYVTSSHAISRKIATKDLNTEGSQYIPSESMLFLEKVREILNEIKSKGKYTFNFSSKIDPNFDKEFLPSVNNGIDLYTNYLKQSVATGINVNLIKKTRRKIVMECMGGSIAWTLDQILKNLDIRDKFDFIHQEEDPFFHQIGKTVDKNNHFFDWSCDTTIMKADLSTMVIDLPVVNTIPYKDLLMNYPVGTVVLMTDPDADRLVTAYIDESKNTEKIIKMGLVFSEIDQNRILVIFTPNQSFLMILDFHQKALLSEGLWDKYDWFILKTTASQRSWDEWAIANNVPVVNTPVGFKELADSMQQVEKKLARGDDDQIRLKDVFGTDQILGIRPRLLFAGEESGGMILGPSEMVTSKKGRKAISMREKSAGEAVIITSALAAWLDKQNIMMADYLQSIFDKNNIKSRYEIRIDQKFYNESEPDIKTLLKNKERGMEIKTKNNSFFLSLALGVIDGLISIDDVRKILNQTFPDLIFDNLLEIKFCGDGTYFVFLDKTLEVRPSGTDAVNKAYAYGVDQWECIKYAQALAGYDGTRTSLHTELIPVDYYKNAEANAFKRYTFYKENQ